MKRKQLYSRNLRNWCKEVTALQLLGYKYFQPIFIRNNFWKVMFNDTQRMFNLSTDVYFGVGSRALSIFYSSNGSDEALSS